MLPFWGCLGWMAGYCTGFPMPQVSGQEECRGSAAQVHIFTLRSAYHGYIFSSIARRKTSHGEANNGHILLRFLAAICDESVEVGEERIGDCVEQE